EICEGGARVQLTDATPPLAIRGLEVNGAPLDLFFLNTGVPHAVVPTADLEAADVRGLGRALRYHARFAPAGTNVNFLQRQGERIAVRTYERGVEDETLACGTGAVASAIVAARLWGLASPIAVQTRSGVVLRISFRDQGERIEEVLLEGPVTRVFAGTAEWPR
ncbi:MAG: diaminopimelate epimerase, partial [Planctomycetota bacterium]|nr:diaminopimelate epimerase [Planctomycetota bacterium]